MKNNILLSNKRYIAAFFTFCSLFLAQDLMACHDFNVDGTQSSIINVSDPCNPVVEICFTMEDGGTNVMPCGREYSLTMTGSSGIVVLTPSNLTTPTMIFGSATIVGNEVVTTMTADGGLIVACAEYTVCPGATIEWSTNNSESGSVSLSVPSVNLDPTFTLNNTLVCKDDVVTITPNATDCGEEWTLDGGAPTATAPTVPTTAAGTFTVCRTVGVDQLAGVCNMQSCQTVTVEDTQAGPSTTVDECFGATAAALTAGCPDCDVPEVPGSSGSVTTTGLMVTAGTTFGNAGTGYSGTFDFAAAGIPAGAYITGISYSAANGNAFSVGGGCTGSWANEAEIIITAPSGSQATITAAGPGAPGAWTIAAGSTTALNEIVPGPTNTPTGDASGIWSIALSDSYDDVVNCGGSGPEQEILSTNMNFTVDWELPAIPATTAPATVAWYPDNGSGAANTLVTPLATTDTYDPIATTDLDPNVPGVYNYFATCECNGCESDPVQHTVTILPAISIVFEQGKCNGNPDGNDTPVGDIDEYDYDVYVNFTGPFAGGDLDITVGGIVIPTITTTATDVQYHITSDMAGVLTTAADGMNITAVLTAGTLVCSATPMALDLPECSCVYDLCDTATTTGEVAPASTADVQPIGYELFYVLINPLGFITQIDNVNPATVDFDVPDSSSGLCSIRSISYNTNDTDAVAAVANITMNATTLDDICSVDGCADFAVSNDACYLIKLNEAAAPAGLTITNSICDINGDLTGGVLNGTAAACEVGSTLNFYSDAAGTSLIGTTAPTFDQENAQTFYTRCLDNTSGCISPLTTVGPTVPGECVCEISGMTLTQDIVCDGTGMYTVQISWTGGPDASVSLAANNGGVMSGDNPATNADGTATFTFDINGAGASGYTITATDTQGVCNFGPFTGTTAPTVFDSIVVEEGDCDTAPTIVLPAGFTCAYTYLSAMGTNLSSCGGTINTAGLGEATYCLPLEGGNNVGAVTFTVTDDCGRTQALPPVNYACFICATNNGTLSSGN